MSRRSALLLVTLTALLAPGALSPGAASAAKPFAHSTYADTDYVLQAELRVAPSGHTFVPKRSGVSYFGNDCTADLRLGRTGKRVHILRRGRFAYTARRHGLRLAVKGRFVTRRKAKLKFSWHRLKGGPRDCDRRGHDSVSPERTTPPRFPGCQAEKAQADLTTPEGNVFHEARWLGGDGWGTVAFACSYAANKRVTIGQDDDDDSDFSTFALAGNFVGYERAECPMGCSFSVGVKDLTTGRTVQEDPGYLSGFGETEVLVLKSDGAVAWSAQASFDTPGAPGIWVHDAGGLKTLDSGPGVDLKSLTLSGSTLSWISGGVTRTAPIN